MAPKTNKRKSVTVASSFVPVSAISLIHPTCVDEFENNYKRMIVMKQHVYDPKVVARLNIPEVVRLMEHQQINSFLNVSTDYNEDLVRVLYCGLESKDGSTFKFNMGKHT